MRQFNGNSPCMGWIETRRPSIRCRNASRFWVRPYRDSEEGQHACAQHLAQVVRDVTNAQPGCEPIVRPFGGDQ